MPNPKHPEMTLQVFKKADGYYSNPCGRQVSACFFNGAAYGIFVFIIALGLVRLGRAESVNVNDGFEVKYVYAGSVYIDAGSRSGVKVGQRLSIKRAPEKGEVDKAEEIGRVEIESIAPTSAAGKILHETSEISPGDIACLIPTASSPSSSSQESTRSTSKSTKASNASPGRETKPVVKKSHSNATQWNENRIRGQIGIDYSTLRIPDSEANSSQFGFVLRVDATRIAGTHWNIHGYHRGRFQTRTNSKGQETLNDLINRTYQLNITYENPDSNWVLGAGRLYLPYATSLNTMDGFYLGRKFGRQTTGFFFGTAPNPTSWNYDPDRQTGGVFYNFEGGSFESLRFDSTSGVALSWLHWKPDRKFGFFENNFFYKRYLSVYSNIEVDLLTGDLNNNRNEAVLSRSYFTVRLQPHKIISFNVSQNYFRNIPTFDTQLIGTGLLDKYLFQGVSGGFRLSLPYRLNLYANTGRSSRTGDSKASWNYVAGASASDILSSRIRLGFRFSRFDSSFGRGTYKTLTLSRELGENVQFELQGGQQNFNSSFTRQDRARFLNGSLDWYMGSRYFLGAGVTIYRGQTQDYNQVFLRLGYRFDNRRRR